MQVLVVFSVLVPVASFAALGWWSARIAPRAGGVIDGRLAPCGAAPNCVVSEAAVADGKHGIAPLALAGGRGAEVWPEVEAAVAALGGAVVSTRDGYLHATFTSRVFRFVDDVEIRRDGDVLHWRSASRVGYSDLGANAARIEALRARLSAAAQR